MAEAIGVASGLLTLAAFAFKSTSALSDAIQSYQKFPNHVSELLGEVQALSGALKSLTETAGASDDTSLAALKLPLFRCGKTCQEFQKEILKCVSRSQDGRTSFRDWTRLKFMGDDIDGFRRSLAAYTLTISVAVADVNLRKSSATAEGLESAKDLIENATYDLENRLQLIDEKLELIFERSSEAADEDAAETRFIKEERLSTQKCLEICSQLYEHIDRMQVAPSHEGHAEFPEQDTLPGQIINEGLQECKASLTTASAKLEKHMDDLVDRMVAKSKRGRLSEEELADLARLRDEWQTTRQCRDVCSKADVNLKENVSSIDNYATGDAIQFMVSTNNKVIHGRNRGLGWRARQVGGHMNDESLQQVTRYLSGVGLQSPEDEDTTSQNREPSNTGDKSKHEPNFRFGERYGPGMKLTPRHNPSVATPPSASADNDRG